MTDQHQRAANLLARADKIIKAVDESYIVKERGHQPRPMPTFKHTEIELGRTLGAGGFGIVNEVTAFDLEHEPEIMDEDDENPKEDDNNKESNPASDNNKNNSSSSSTGKKEEKVTEEPVGAELYDDDSHYDIEEARELMRRRCLRRGVTRFALKRLHEDLNEMEKARAMIDLAVEAKYLSVVWHPNIGTCAAPPWFFGQATGAYQELC